MMIEILKTTTAKDWRELLAFPKKGIFSSFVLFDAQKDQRNTFYYQNESSKNEIVTPLLLNTHGAVVEEVPIHSLLVAPGGSVCFKANEALELAKKSEFIGTIMFIVRPENETFDTGAKDLLSVWETTKSYCQIGMAMFVNVNTPETVGKKSYFMYSPNVEISDTSSSRTVVINSSTDDKYNDSIECLPILENELGETLSGPSTIIPPFGSLVIDADEYFGAEGIKLLEKTNGRGTISISHKGHILSSMFFKIDKKNRTIVSGSHTQPPIGVIFPVVDRFAWIKWMVQYIPLAYLLTGIRRYFRA